LEWTKECESECVWEKERERKSAEWGGALGIDPEHARDALGAERRTREKETETETDRQREDRERERETKRERARARALCVSWGSEASTWNRCERERACRVRERECVCV